jgi:hypothetical protein
VPARAPLGRVTVAVAVCAANSACSSVATQLSPVGDSPGASFTASAATVPVGVVVGFSATSESSMPVTASVDDTTIATVAPTVKSGTFVLVGLATGQTTLHVFVNDADAVDVAVQVLPTAE